MSSPLVRRVTALERAPGKRGLDLRMFATVAEADADAAAELLGVGGGPGRHGCSSLIGCGVTALERRLVRLEGAVAGPGAFLRCLGATRGARRC